MNTEKPPSLEVTSCHPAGMLGATAAADAVVFVAGLLGNDGICGAFAAATFSAGGSIFTASRLRTKLPSLLPPFIVHSALNASSEMVAETKRTEPSAMTA